MKNVRAPGTASDRETPSKTRARRGTFVVPAAGIGALFCTNACGHDWASYDPRVDEPGVSSSSSSSSSSSVGSGGMGGSGGSGGTGGAAGSGGLGGIGGMGGLGGAGGSAGTGGTGGIPGAGGAGGAIACDPNVKIPCYTGPAGTLGVGACQAGSLTCAADGMIFGTCEGDTAPKADRCGSAIDEDCNGQTDEHCANWSKRFGVNGDQRGIAVAVGSDGRVVVAGRMSGSVNFGGGPLTSAGGDDVFVVKLEANGTFLWAKRFGGENDEEPSAVSIDPMGNIVIVGYHGGPIGFGGAVDPIHPSTGWDDAFVAKLGPDGSYQWSQSWGGASDQYAFSVATDAAGNIVVGGGYDASIDFGGGMTATGNDWLDGFVVLMDAAGSIVWTKVFGGSGYDSASGVGIASNGDVLITGEYETSVDFGMGSPPDESGQDLFIVRLDGTGNQVFLESFGGAGDQFPIGAALNADDHFTIAGQFTNDITFNNTTYHSAGDYDVFAFEIDPMGQVVWGRTFGDASSQEAWGVAANPGGGLVVTGSMKGSVDFGAGPPLVNVDDLASGNDDIFVLNLGPDGATKWAKSFGDMDDQDGRAVAVGTDGSVCITGEIAGSTNFGAGPLTSASGSVAYVAKFAP